MQPDLAVACSTDSHRLLAKQEWVTAMGAASLTWGGEPLVAWGSPIPRVVTSFCSELGLF